MKNDHDPAKESKRERLQRLQRRQGLERKERVRLVFMVGGLVFAVGLFLYVRLGVGKKVDTDKMPMQVSGEQALGSEIIFPQIDSEIFEDVKDATETDRLLLEQASLSRLLKSSRGLFPAHLDALEQEQIPFDEFQTQPDHSRGLPYRIRGSLEDFRFVTRTLDGPDEAWALIKTDQGNFVHYASLTAPEEWADSEGLYIVAEGFFFKNYTRTIEGERVTAPLMVGREFRRSVRRSDPVEKINFGILAEVTDGQFGDEDPVQDAGYWHLMNYANQVRDDPSLVDAEFAGARGISGQTVKDMLVNPELFRGAPYKIYGQTVKSGTKACGENPMRLRYSSYSFLHKWELDDHYIHLVTPGREMLDGIDLRYEVLAYFHKLWAYEDGKGNMRRVPVFVAAGLREREVSRSQLEGEIVLMFVGLFAVFGLGFWYLIRRDRKQTELAAQAFRDRRRQRRSGT